MSKQLKVTIIKGERLEKELSFKFHELYTPVLISSKVLRSRGAGQIDLCYLHQELLNVIECKNGGILSPKQYTRLKNSGEILGNILDKSVFIKLVFAK